MNRPGVRSPCVDQKLVSLMGLSDHLIIGVLVLTSHLILLLLFHGDSILLVEAQTTNFSYGYFSSPDSFWLVDDVEYHHDKTSFVMNARGVALQIGSCGRLLYQDRVKMKDTASGAVASFHTAFTFSITGLDGWVDSRGVVVHGDGLAFTFVSERNFTDQNSGSTLCLVKEDSNGLASNQVFAVEFDTFRNPNLNDPSDNHIGVDRNSVNSSWAYNLCGGTQVNCTYLCNGGSHTAWIDYDGVSQKLDVFFANGSLADNIAKPVKPVIEATLPLADLLADDFMYVGFSASVGQISEVHQIESWEFASSGMPEQVASAPTLNPNPVNGSSSPNGSSSSGSKVGVIAGVCGGVAAALLIAGLCIARCWWGGSYRKQENRFDLVDQNLVPRMFTYKELSKATRNFSRSELLGSGGFGAVYKGTLPSGALVAVKRMRHESQQAEQGFQAEAASLSQIRHRNLVQLRGWCHEEEQLLLVYNYMCNGSLDEWLFQSGNNNNNNSSTSWDLKAAEEDDHSGLALKQRHSILSGVAAALSYLHEECKQCVLHRDIKSSNVLLDEEMNAYLGDFGLARLIDHQKIEKTTMMAGTIGYMAPEMPHTGKATKESDVYSFGVLTLEVMCGTRALDMGAIQRGEGLLVDRVWRAHEAGDLLLVADSKLGTSDADPSRDSSSGLNSEPHELSSTLLDPSSEIYNPKKLTANLLHLGLLCCNPNPEDRPSMRLASQSLQVPESMDYSLPALPRCKPQARYALGLNFAQMVTISSVTSATLSAVHVQEAAQGPPSTLDVSFKDRPRMQTSFTSISTSSMFSGR